MTAPPPAPGPALLARAVEHQSAGRHAEAAAAYRAAIAAGESVPEVHNNLGVALRAAGDAPGAIAAFRAALALRSGYTRAAFNLAALLRMTGQPAQAAEALEAALASGGDATLRDEAARAWTDAIRPDRAHPHLLAAHQAAPEDPFRRSALANALMTLGRPMEALAHHRIVTTALPDRAEAGVNCAHALMAVGRPGEAAAICAEILMRDRDCWPAWHNRLLALNYLHDVTPEAIAAEHRCFGDHLATRVMPLPPPGNTPDPDRVLRIGFVSGDLRGHSVGYLLEGVVAALDPGRHALFAYANQAGGDHATERMLPSFAVWRHVAAMNDAALAAAIRADGIDILVDLSGHTGGNRLALFALRPAPVQVAWIGYPQTTGLAAMDWIVADAQALPPADEALYRERVIRLPGSYLCYAVPGPAIPRSPAPILARGYATFGCFNGLAKLNDAVLHAWARILSAVPDARLLVKTRALAEAATATSFRERFAAQGGDVARLDVENHLPERLHRARFAAVDMMLDPFPYGGCTSTIEAIHAGVPTLALRGRGGMMTRSAETLLAAIGMDDWIARDVEDYVAQAVSRGRDPQALAAARVRTALGPLADAPAFARGLEQAWRAMWRDWCARAVSGAPGSPAPPR